MHFQVPQFIEIEDKIFGPLTFKQFIYVAGGAGLGFVIFSFLSNILPTVFAIVAAIPCAVLGVALAFYRVNDRPLILALEAAFWYYARGKLYQWRKVEKKSVQSAAGGTQVSELKLPAVTKGTLSDLSWSLDINEKVSRNS